MLTLVSGGAASGKSEFAEHLILQSNARPLVYLATMEIWDQEDQRRADRHRLMRRDKGFQTVEAARMLETVTVPAQSAVLLECMSNLCVNECFGPDDPQGAYDRIARGIENLLTQCQDLVIVTSEICSDGRIYTPESEHYKQVLAQINQMLARRAQNVWEVCCGIPIHWKGDSL